jgi:hypothetical protein
MCLRMSATGCAGGSATRWCGETGVSAGTCLLADCARLRTAGMKPTSRGRVDRIWGDRREALGPRSAVVRVHRWNGRRQGTGIRVAGICAT